MAPVFNLVKDVNPSKTLWALKLRLVRAYDVPVYGKENEVFSFECVFKDREGSTIHGSVKRPYIEKYKPMLKEGNLYIISNMIVAENILKYKTTSFKYKFNFYGKTMVKKFTDDTFPRNIFDFKPFDHILSDPCVDETQLFDVIGWIVGMEPPKLKDMKNGPKRMMEIVLEDLENARLTCTLWDEYTDKLLPFLNVPSTEPIIVVLQMCRAKLFREEVKVSNTFYVTKLIVNGNEGEIKDFQKRLSKIYDRSRTISTISEVSGCSITNEFERGNAVVKKLDQLCESNEEGMFWVFCTIADVENIENCWYLSCKRCHKKLFEEESRFFCQKCGQQDEIGSYRYKIEIRVIDGTGNALFLLWNNESIELIGKTATEIKQITHGSVSNEIQSLVDRQVLFKVQVKHDQPFNYKSAFTVIKLTVDPEITTRFAASYNESQESDLFSKLHRADTEKEKEESSEDEVSTPEKNLSRVAEDVDLEDDVQVKRRLVDEFSSTIAKKKGKAVIKTEKEEK